MNEGSYSRFFIWILTLVSGIGIGTAMGQQAPPKEDKGVAPKVMSTIDLAPDLSAYQFRLRTITVEPGGIVALHSHKERPAFGYLLEGTYTENRDGGYTREYKAGDAITESRDVIHWGYNRGKDRLVILAVDIIKTP